MLNFRPNFQLIQLNDLNWGRQFDSILKLSIRSFLHLLRVWLVSRGVPIGRSFFSFIAISARCFIILTFWIDGCLLRKESLHTQSFSKLLTVQPIHTLNGRRFESLIRIEPHIVFLEYRIDPSSREVKFGLIFGQKLPFYCIGARWLKKFFPMKKIIFSIRSVILLNSYRQKSSYINLHKSTQCYNRM
jgi:hypothetical protein